jgi:hypothetical protein
MSASASAAACPATSASVTAARNVTVTHKRAGDVLPALYSSNVLEWGFSEVPLQHYASPRPGGPASGGAIIQAEGIIRALCMLGYEPPILYIRSYAT